MKTKKLLGIQLLKLENYETLNAFVSGQHLGNIQTLAELEMPIDDVFHADIFDRIENVLKRHDYVFTISATPMTDHHKWFERERELRGWKNGIFFYVVGKPTSYPKGYSKKLG